VTRNRVKKRDLQIAPATLLDMADLAEAVGATRSQWGFIRETWQIGPSWALRAGGQLVGVAGLAPIGPGQAEAWFHFRPAAAGVMLAVVRAIRLTMDASPYRAIVTFCTSEPGKRIARAAGFHFAEHSEFGEVWAYGHPGRGPRAAADAEPAAHQPGATGRPAD
jgi:hypothetical protein